jgi:hypothetical protein
MTTTTDKTTVYTFAVYVTVPMDTDNDGTPDYPTISAKDVGRQLAAGFRRCDGDIDYELMDTEVKTS